MDKNLHKCFKKIHIKNVKGVLKNDEVTCYLQEKARLTASLPFIKCNLAKNIIANKIYELEEKVSLLCSERNSSIIKDHTQHLRNSEGKFSQLSMWRLKSKIIPQQTNLPAAKRDQLGNLITEPNELMALYVKTYKERLKSNEVDPTPK